MSLSEVMEIVQSHQKNYPVLTIPICEALGIKVFTLKEREDFSGMIKKEDDKTFSIYVNESHSDERQRFTIAHEIGHYALHRDKIGDGIVDDALYRSGLQSFDETEANKFAANLLMPFHLIFKAMDEHKTKDAKSLAKKFRVSEVAMSVRLGLLT